MAILDREALNKRAQLLDDKLNGIELVLVRLNPAANPTEAILEVHFYNSREIAAVAKEAETKPTVFRISGGRRVPAGPLAGQVKTASVAKDPAAENVLLLTVKPIGDYSVYTLGLEVEKEKFDPLFSEISFKFRPSCFNADCAPPWKARSRDQDTVVNDYLAKDYDSFKHTMIVAMMERVPGWQPTSEADLDQVLLELFSAAGDELSDYQDRVMNEAYLATARKRVSLARHARLVDYHVHQGNQASTVLAFELPDTKPVTVPAGIRAWTGPHRPKPDTPVFLSKQSQAAATLLNRISLYTWSDAAPSLEAGATSADLKLARPDETPTEQVCAWINDGKLNELLLEEKLNPATGRATDRDPNKRQILRLLRNAELIKDPLTSEWTVRVHWLPEDKLRTNYCFTVTCRGAKVEDVSVFHGNLVRVFHGAERTSVFKEPGAVLGPDDMYFERTRRWGAVCRLPAGPLAYENTPPGGTAPPKSTLEVTVRTSAGEEKWHEHISLIHSDNGNHFIVETDEDGLSTVRFGNGQNGRALPEGAVVSCSYQIGWGPDGNVGADAIAHCAVSGMAVTNCWNPFAAIDGTAPEPFASVIRRAPQAYRFRQLRAVTLQDYVDRAQELPEVQRVSAVYAWTGSWRTVRIAIDPKGGLTLDDTLRKKLARHLDAVRLLGEDLEIRPPKFVPLEIHVKLCAGPEYWPDDLRFVLQQSFSADYLPDGQPAFFHPDRWTFGLALHRSQLEGTLMAIDGVEHVISICMRRWNSSVSGNSEMIKVESNEIIEVLSDPDRMEQGYIDFEIQGGRR